MGFSASDSALNGLRRLALQTGLLTMTTSVIVIVLFTVPSTGLSYLVFQVSSEFSLSPLELLALSDLLSLYNSNQIPSSKLYSNSLLSVLLNRPVNPANFEDLDGENSESRNGKGQGSQYPKNTTIKDAFKFQLGMLRPQTRVEIVEEHQEVQEEIEIHEVSAGGKRRSGRNSKTFPSENETISRITDQDPLEISRDEEISRQKKMNDDDDSIISENPTNEFTRTNSLGSTLKARSSGSDGELKNEPSLYRQPY